MRGRFNRTLTKVVYKHCRAFDQREHRILLQLHIFWNLDFFEIEKVSKGRARLQHREKKRTADFAIRVTSARGSSKFSMPSDTAFCWACADAGVLALSFRGIAGSGPICW